MSAYNQKTLNFFAFKAYVEKEINNLSIRIRLEIICYVNSSDTLQLRGHETYNGSRYYMWSNTVASPDDGNKEKIVEA